jgi:hypothetical protein
MRAVLSDLDRTVPEASGLAFATPWMGDMTAIQEDMARAFHVAVAEVRDGLRKLLPRPLPEDERNRRNSTVRGPSSVRPLLFSHALGPCDRNGVANPIARYEEVGTTKAIAPRVAETRAASRVG